jgi:predicted dehydrogenase/threonine dehydrogenase-like Zn-dependent dehydrogenase
VRQLLQNRSTGDVRVDEVPPPVRGPAQVLVANRFSVISAGTERAILELGRASIVEKARARPDLVAKVVDSVRNEGVSATYAKVRGRLGEPNALGYSTCGVVLEACDGSPAAPGEWVACAGAGFASHAEIIAIPRNLTARVPEGVAPEDAAYATVASIALHGVRLSEVRLGDVAGVIGLGLVGQITVELLAASGAVPIGFDPDPRRVDLARAGGVLAFADANELESEVARLTERRGADAVLVTAASKTSAPLATATAIARERAVISVVGDVGIESPRAPLFAKELRLVVSRSYGPGRYDPTYEELGIDYPAGYVRWTEGRNLAEVLRLMADGALRPSRLTTHTFDLEEGPRAYAVLGSQEDSLGIVLRYPGRNEPGRRTVELRGRRRRQPSPAGARLRVGVIGAGAFASGVLMPAIARNAEITAVANRTGVSASAAGARFGARIASTEPADLIGSSELDAIVIATRHDTHAEYAVRALEQGKHVFVEKPLGLNLAELESVVEAAEDSPGILMVGFNRRFAPLAVRLREALAERGPLVMTCRVNAGRLPAGHWTHDSDVGGGRIVGEACHFVDLLTFLAGGLPRSVTAAAVGGSSEPREDNVAATLELSDGSVGQIVYSAMGDPGLPKERIEVLGEAGAGVLEDFCDLRLYRSGVEKKFAGKRNKGHDEEVAAFVAACVAGRQPWPVHEMAEVMRATFAIREAVCVAQPLVP